MIICTEVFQCWTMLDKNHKKNKFPYQIKCPEYIKTENQLKHIVSFPRICRMKNGNATVLSKIIFELGGKWYTNIAKKHIITISINYILPFLFIYIIKFFKKNLYKPLNSTSRDSSFLRLCKPCRFFSFKY